MAAMPGHLVLVEGPSACTSGSSDMLAGSFYFYERVDLQIDLLTLNGDTPQVAVEDAGRSSNFETSS